MGNNSSNGQNRHNWLKYLSFGSELVVLLSIGVYGGLKLDEYFHSLPLFTILLPAIGMVYSFWKLLKNLDKDRKS